MAASADASEMSAETLAKAARTKMFLEGHMNSKLAALQESRERYTRMDLLCASLLPMLNLPISLPHHPTTHLFLLLLGFCLHVVFPVGSYSLFCFFSVFLSCAFSVSLGDVVVGDGGDGG
jgi:hypothetical protein